ncbi:dihydrolipoamide acetyltransferase family protein [Actinomadura macrotermitis]|uniref:Dihydrolipoamide acetyltransferase component of pyruvate dehydrogenase complex n=1 Tax=Actinomadura macrotermitis TaxID=2585200 RepID=A0A7K0BUH8_9ACTN|nr:dihydrolipoamide acetyltransferase family protein [Actinomadura macrotermitis]MQY04860.1 Dihydrolipoyllysine-residue acetyltransferase component of pyruvate dehydrogenase complex [Actinomadura macrotermitis]
MSELKRFKLPDVGEGLTEAEIVKWHVAVGDAVEVNQTIVEIETAKAIVELPCPFEGTVTELLAAEGETVDVGVPIITVDVGGGEAPAEPVREEALKDDLVPTPEEPGMTAPEQPKRQPVLVGYGVKPGATQRRPRKSAAPPPARPQPVDSGRVLAKPPVRKMAKDLGVDLSTITGTGPQGSITRDDIRAARQAPAAPQRPAVEGDEERIPVKGVRKATANAMVASAFTAPHVTEFLQVDVTRTMETVRRLRDLPEFAQVKVSPLLLVAKALLTAVARHPMANATWDGEEIVVKRRVNLGIAAATERGLIVPNIKDAHAKPLPELAEALAALTETARSGRARPADLSGGTITITNVGVFGVDTGTPIITPGEAAILAFGQVRDMPWVHEGELAIRKVTTLALSFDHRIIDGELGSKVLRDVGAMLEDPIRMLAWN